MGDFYAAKLGPMCEQWSRVKCVKDENMQSGMIELRFIITSLQLRCVIRSSLVE